MILESGKLKCDICKHEWYRRKKGKIYKCPRCQTPRWNEKEELSE